jgi:aspartate 1-decarboxylase
VKDHSLLAVDFKPGQLPAGEPGPKGDKGDAGAPGISGYEIVSGRNDVTNQGFNTVAITCPAGKKAIGGGGATAGGISPGDGPYIIVDQPSSTAAAGSYKPRAAKTEAQSYSATRSAPTSPKAPEHNVASFPQKRPAGSTLR